MALQTIMAEFYSLYFKLYLQLSLTSKTFSSIRKTFLCTCCDTVPDDVKKKLVHMGRCIHYLFKSTCPNKCLLACHRIK